MLDGPEMRAHNSTTLIKRSTEMELGLFAYTLPLLLAFIIPTALAWLLGWE